MNMLKKLTALIMVAAVCFGLVGCHPKNEVALSVGGKDYTSAFYMCALLQADGEAKSKIDEAYEEKDKDTADIDYYKEKIDKKSYEDWVKDRAVELCRIYAYVETMCDEKEIKISETDLESTESSADNYWNNYGYSTYYGANGVSYETFKEYYTYATLSQTYFLSIYGEDGTDPVAAEDIKTTLSERFILANYITVSLQDDSGVALSDDEIAKQKTKLESYKTRLDNGEAFKTIYEAENGAQTETPTEEEQPQDTLAQIFGNEDTQSYASEYYDDLQPMQVGETKIIEDTENKQLLLVLKKDIMADPYYLKNMSEYIIHLLKYDDYEADCKEQAKELEFEQNTFATNRFKVKKLKSGTEE
ncbi:MAG: hypothetical protein IJW78_03615 [Clostridia bacterium]|nr:hypothetical protein [Clostridia bacterium]